MPSEIWITYTYPIRKRVCIYVCVSFLPRARTSCRDARLPCRASMPYRLRCQGRFEKPANTNMWHTNFQGRDARLNYRVSMPWRLRFRARFWSPKNTKMCMCECERDLRLMVAMHVWFVVHVCKGVWDSERDTNHLQIRQCVCVWESEIWITYQYENVYVNVYACHFWRTNDVCLGVGEFERDLGHLPNMCSWMRDATCIYIYTYIYIHIYIYVLYIYICVRGCVTCSNMCSWMRDAYVSHFSRTNGKCLGIGDCELKIYALSVL